MRYHRLTLAALALAAMPAIALAQATDTTRRAGERTRDQQERGTSNRGREVSASRRSSSATWGLNREQITQLQQAINDRTDCDAGTADGRVGPRTRRAASCARRELGIRGNDMTELFTALELDFGDAAERGNDASTRGRGRDTTAAARRRGGAGRDTSARPVPPGSQRDTTRQSPR